MKLQRGCTVWLTGLSGAVKTAIAGELAPMLRERGCRVEVLEDDVVRTNLSEGLGSSKKDMDIIIHRIGFVCNLLARNGVFTIVAANTPDRLALEENRTLSKDYVEVYVKALLEPGIQPGVKEVDKKALIGEISEFTGVSDPDELPENPDMICDTETETTRQSAEKIVRKLEEQGYLVPPKGNEGDVYTREEEELVKQRLEELGYL